MRRRMSGITTHVLDVSRGRPAAAVPVVLERRTGLPDAWTLVGRGATDADGRARDLVSPPARVEPGVYRITFDTAAWFRAQGVEGFYPEVRVVFEIRNAAEHHHVPLLLSPFGYSTYRGS
jgi:5-hydroxyisourate hydrolase